jgi:hypothetical protein
MLTLSSFSLSFPDRNDYDGTINNSTGGIVVNPGRITADFIESL